MIKFSSNAVLVMLWLINEESYITKNLIYYSIGDIMRFKEY